MKKRKYRTEHDRQAQNYGGEKTELTAAEWWDFAPWHSMDSAPRGINKLIIARLKTGRTIIVSFYLGTWSSERVEYETDEFIGWLPLSEVK